MTIAPLHLISHSRRHSYTEEADADWINISERFELKKLYLREKRQSRFFRVKIIARKMEKYVTTNWPLYFSTKLTISYLPVLPTIYPSKLSCRVLYLSHSYWTLYQMAFLASLVKPLSFFHFSNNGTLAHCGAALIRIV